MNDLLDTIKMIREIARERSRFLQELANLVVQAAGDGLDHIPSSILLEKMQEHNDRVKEMNDRMPIKE